MPRSRHRFGDALAAPTLGGRVAWITGGSRGIGRGIAHALAANGAHVILGARGLAPLEQEVAALRAGGAKADCLALDVRDPASVRAFCASASELAGDPYILVNNAGVGGFMLCEEFSEEQLDDILRTNLCGPIWMTRGALPGMKRRGEGVIVNVSSLAGGHPYRRGTAYCASKAGLDAFSESLFLETREFGVRVVLVVPGAVDTRFHADAHPNANLVEQDWMATPQDVGRAVAMACLMPPESVVSRIEVRSAQVPTQWSVGERA